jgi:hypothetical protein
MKEILFGFKIAYINCNSFKFCVKGIAHNKAKVNILSSQEQN